MSLIDIKSIQQSKYFFSIFALMIMMAFSSVVSSSFLTMDNMLIILRQASLLLIFSAGLTVVILAGGIDLSVGNTAALIGCLIAKIMVSGYSPGIAVIMGLFLGIIVGLFNGFLVGILRLAPFVATYCTNMVVSGLATIVMQGSVIYGLPSDFNNVGVGYVGVIPLPVIIAAAVVLFFYMLLQRTTFGRNVYMLGSNAEAAKYSAMNTLKMQFASYALCGLTAAMGGIILTARMNAAEAAMGETYGLQIVAAVVMGGTSLLGGEGGIIGTVIGALILTIIVNIMNLAGLHSNWQSLAVGMVIILMCFIDIYTRGKKDRKI